ncbi:hypothetical protein FG93_04972 [Bosea sp. LC85]|uniref:DUF6880 family protein n=1 Tax=Bosea sp. LC85 TaxID=1502851 RepID=UPI0004E390AC|nr:DUF6880 family protein [Bosea sp. LC85]KFC64950.1 hypothetical protein FG93_04972 [Bosea sp. LC85]
MASGKTFDSKRIAALGVGRLAQILFELAEGDAAIKRRLRLELASSVGTDQVAGEIRKRLATIAKSRSFIDWHKMRAFAQDLEAQRQAIVTHVAPKQPSEAFDLLWQFLGLAPAIHERCDDSNGMVGGIMSEALEDLGRAAQAAKPAPGMLAEKVFAGVCANEYGQFDHLVTLMAGPLGQEGLTILKKKFEALAADPPKPAGKDERRAIGWSSSRGALYEDDLAIRRHARLVQSALTEIADTLGDVDGYVSRFSREEQANPAIAAQIAERLLAAGRAGDAMAALTKAEALRKTGGSWPDWDRVRIDTLDASGRADEAQRVRWSLFEKLLHADYLKAYLKRLPDFDNDEAEERALAHAGTFADFHQGLGFLIEWPAPEAAAKMILARHSELDGDHYGCLTDAAEALETKHPLAATLALRAMIDFALDKARATRYPHAARHLQTCADLARRIGDYNRHVDHDTYVAARKAKHGRKSGFWNA